MDLFKKETYTLTENNLIGEAFDNPIVRKYLNDQLTQAFAAIAGGQPAPGQPAEEYLREVALVQGNIQAFKLLLAIKKAPVEENQNQ